MSSILAIDYGLKRIGLAVSDVDRIFAFPIGIVENKNFNFVLENIKKEISIREVDLIIIGMPYNMDNSKGEMAQQVDYFINKLKENLTIEILTVDERLSSFAAEENLRELNMNSKKIKSFVDAEAARILLEEFIKNGK